MSGVRREVEWGIKKPPSAARPWRTAAWKEKLDEPPRVER